MSPSGDTAKDADLSKLTVAQLKALCKQGKIVGYSKLGKPALVQKLVEHGYTSGNVSAPITGQSSVAGTVLTSAVSPTHPTPNVPPPAATTGTRGREPDPSAPGSITSKTKASAPNAKGKARKAAHTPATANSSKNRETLTGVSSTQDTPTLITVRLDTGAVYAATVASIPHASGDAYITEAPSQLQQRSSAFAPPPTSGASHSALDATPSVSANISQDVATEAKKRPRTDTKAMPPPKKPRIQPPRTAPGPQQDIPPNSKSALGSQTTPHSRLSIAADVSRPVRPVPAVIDSPGPAATILPAASLLSVPAKRFRPLVVDKSKLSSANPRRPTTGATSDMDGASGPQPQNAPAVLRYLEFPTRSMALPTLRPISMPPPLAQRKRVNRWAVILSGLSDKERAICVLVSRTFRYAVYLSASSVLARGYRGRRLQKDVLSKYSQAMTNMWPYLRLREAEVAERRRIYEASFLPRFFERCGVVDPISEHLWASPGNPRQLVIAVRFLLTRAWFELSVGTSSGAKEDPMCWLRGTIVDAQEVAKDEIWSVTLEYPQISTETRRRETIYVIEATCEVVGRPSANVLDGSDAASTCLPVRADWSTYIACRAASSPDEPGLVSHLKWAGHEEFDRGISKLWLSRVAGEGDHGVAKQRVAERYVLSCVVGNSISGKWLSVSEMAQDFAGLPSRGAPLPMPRTKKPTMNLYLPEHHHVESVHFTSSGGDALHPALATVQTPHREYYILRDNGMQVGCEEEGVAAVWQEVLGCDHRGMSM